jgi:UDP-N-acetylmuramate dehydrogenase
MNAMTTRSRLIERLPPVRGRLAANSPLAPYTWFRVGGAAEVLFRPADLDDLAAFLAARPKDVPVTVIGVGSNLLVRDGGVPGVVIRLGRGFSEIDPQATRIIVGAGTLDATLAATAAEAGIAGLEFLIGVPGTIGGALRMNAGAYGSEIKDVFIQARALDLSGWTHVLGPDEMGFSYRHTAVPEDWIFVQAILSGRPDDAAAIRQRMAEIKANREASQPIRTRTGGSSFTNPPGAKAWELIERAGCRGLRVGGAQVSEMHCNFLVNTGGATAAEIEALGEEVRRRVLETTGVALQWEIRRIGINAEDAR